ncbi:MAG: cyclic nucleotide-binding domain-containing protein [Pseudolabrys sp.]
MLSQMTNFSVTPNFSNKAPVAHPAIAYSWADSFETMGTSMSFPRNAEIYGENEPAEHLYKLVSGSVRISKVLNDGRRQISAFYLPGDVFGL